MQRRIDIKARAIEEVFESRVPMHKEAEALIENDKLVNSFNRLQMVDELAIDKAAYRECNSVGEKRLCYKPERNSHKRHIR